MSIDPTLIKHSPQWYYWNFKKLFPRFAARCYVDKVLFDIGHRFYVDVLKLDDTLHELHGDYEEDRGLSMRELLVAEYSQEASDFVASSIGPKLRKKIIDV